jgi:thiosulfate/3-mercaptopyruvate sulfurtransferase
MRRYLKYYGHDRVRLLNGPRERWIAEGRPMTSAPPNHAPTTFTAGTGDDSSRAMRDEVLGAVGTERVFIDVRSPHEYQGRGRTGTDGCNEPVQRSGHIPGARSIPWAQAVNKDGTFRGASELRELYARSGALSGAPVISYCRIGERSAHTWFVLHELLGQAGVKNYDGSWTEWGNLIGAPIERG